MYSKFSIRGTKRFILLQGKPENMISLPFRTGTVAAFFFLFSELFLFPILFYSTTILAALFINRQASGQREVIDTKPIRFPLWNEGLFCHQIPHLFLLALRAIFIIIPVYLESQLESKRTPNSVNLSHAYTPEPLSNFSFPNLKPELDGSFPRDILEISGVIFNRCSRVDQFGWRVASIANVSVLQNGKRKIICLPRTERRAFRQLSNMDADNLESKIPQSPTLDLRLSWNFGWFDASHERRDNPFIEYVKLDVIQNMICYANRLQLVNTKNEEAIRTVVTKLKDMALCQDGRQNFTSFYRFTNCIHKGIKEDDHEKVKSFMNGSMDQQEMVSVNSHRVKCEIQLLERLQFDSENVLTAQNFVYVRNLKSFHDIENTKHRHLFNDLTARSLYTKRENYLIELEGDTFGVTEIPNRVIAIGITEIFIVLLFSILMWYIASFTNQVFQKPNTLNGLSEIWALSRTVQENMASGKFSKRVLLRLEQSNSTPTRFSWVPTANIAKKKTKEVKCEFPPKQHINTLCVDLKSQIAV